MKISPTADMVELPSSSSKITMCGLCTQRKLPASFWPHEGISLALLSGPGIFHKLGEKEEASETLRIHTLAPSSFADERSHLPSGVYGGGALVHGGI